MTLKFSNRTRSGVIAVLLITAVMVLVAALIYRHVQYDQVALTATGPTDDPITLTVTAADGSTQVYQLRNGESRKVLVREGSYSITTQQGKAVTTSIGNTAA